MKCPHCGAESNEQHFCSQCNSPLDSVQVLSREERDQFDGVTIDSGSGWNKENNYSYQQTGNGFQFKVKTFNFGSMSLLTKLVLAGGALFFMFIALPLVLLFAVVAAVLWWGLKGHR